MLPRRLNDIMEKARPTAEQLQADRERIAGIIEQRENFSTRLVSEGAGPYRVAEGTKQFEGTDIEVDILIGEKRKRVADKVEASIPQRLQPAIAEIDQVLETETLVAEAASYRTERDTFDAQYTRLEGLFREGVVKASVFETYQNRQAELLARAEDPRIQQGLALLTEREGKEEQEASQVIEAPLPEAAIVTSDIDAPEVMVASVAEPEEANEHIEAPVEQAQIESVFSPLIDTEREVEVPALVDEAAIAPIDDVTREMVETELEDDTKPQTQGESETVSSSLPILRIDKATGKVTVEYEGKTADVSFPTDEVDFAALVYLAERLGQEIPTRQIKKEVLGGWDYTTSDVIQYLRKEFETELEGVTLFQRSGERQSTTYRLNAQVIFLPEEITEDEVVIAEETSVVESDTISPVQEVVVIDEIAIERLAVNVTDAITETKQEFPVTLPDGTTIAVPENEYVKLLDVLTLFYNSRVYEVSAKTLLEDAYDSKRARDFEKLQDGVRTLNRQHLGQIYWRIVEVIKGTKPNFQNTAYKLDKLRRPGQDMPENTTRADGGTEAHQTVVVTGGRKVTVPPEGAKSSYTVDDLARELGIKKSEVRKGLDALGVKALGAATGKSGQSGFSSQAVASRQPRLSYDEYLIVKESLRTRNQSGGTTYVEVPSSSTTPIEAHAPIHQEVSEEILVEEDENEIPILAAPESIRLPRVLVNRRGESIPDENEFQAWYQQQLEIRQGDPTVILQGREQGPWELLQTFNDRVLFEDDHILVLNKPPFVNSHYGSVFRTGVEEIARHLRGPELELAHRLDSDTTGVLLLTKNDEAQWEMRRQFADKNDSGIEKTYVTILDGAIKSKDRIQVAVPIARTDTERMRVVKAGEYARGAVNSLTYFRPLAILRPPFRSDAKTLTEVQIVTGRTHQIRVVAADFLGHPVVGDRMYNPNPYGAPRYLLHARKLTFNHPATKEQVTFEAPAPADFEQYTRSMEVTPL